MKTSLALRSSHREELRIPVSSLTNGRKRLPRYLKPPVDGQWPLGKDRLSATVKAVDAAYSKLLK